MKNQGAITRFTMFLCLFIVTEAVCFNFSSFFASNYYYEIEAELIESTSSTHYFHVNVSIVLSMRTIGTVVNWWWDFSEESLYNCWQRVSLHLSRSLCILICSFVRSFFRLQKMHRNEIENAISMSTCVSISSMDQQTFSVSSRCIPHKLYHEYKTNEKNWICAAQQWMHSRNTWHCDKLEIMHHKTQIV